MAVRFEKIEEAEASTGTPGVRFERVRTESADTPAARFRAAAQGATLGFADEGEAAVRALISRFSGDERPYGDIYTGIRDELRGEQEAFSAERPGLSTALQIGGGVVTGGAGAARMAGTQLARRLAAAPLRNRLAAASVGGAAGGAVGGAGEAETVEDIPAAATRAAIPGLLLGPVAELGITGAGALRQAMTPQRAAERTAARALDRSGLTPAQASARLEALGPDATLADVGEGTAAALESAANQPGATRALASRQLGARSRRQADEITEPFGPGRVLEMGEDLARRRAEQASPLYERAFARGVPHTERLDDLFSRPAVRDAWKKAKRRGQDVSGIDPETLGDVRPSLEGWQAVKEHLDDRVSSLFRQGKNKRAREIQEKIIDPLLDELDANSPDYARARSLWAGTKQFEDAMERGRAFIREPSSVAIGELRRMSDVDRAAYRAGVAQAIQDKVERAGDLHDVTKFFRTKGMRRKMRALFDSPEEYADFMNRISASWAKQRTMNQALGNSATARRLAAAEEEGAAPAIAGAVADVVTGTPAATVAGGGLRSLARRIPTSRQATRDAVGQMMLETDPAALNRMMRLIESGGTPYARGTSGIGAPLALGIVGGGLLPEER